MPLQATSGAASYDAFGGGVPVVPNYIEDVFSSYLWTGNGTTQTITNGIDLSGKGGMVWRKQRDATADHFIADTVRGTYSTLSSNTTSAASGSSYIGFLSNGFQAVNSGSSNPSGSLQVGWTFRKQPKFFDIVTWSGDSIYPRTITHNLGSTPGCIITKNTTESSNWFTYHRSLGNFQALRLNTTAAPFVSSNNMWNATSTSFTLTADLGMNESGSTYIAYIFAHDAGGFGLTGTDNVISCGSFTTDGSGNATISLGYEPQWLLVKQSSGTGFWRIWDTMRGWSVATSGGSTADLYPNDSAAENFGGANGNGGFPTATGFYANGGVFNPSQTHIYIAIRRGPMKVPTTGTSVFSPIAYTGDNSSNRVIGSLPAGDSALVFTRNYNDYAYPQTWWSRLTGGLALRPYNTNAEVNQATTLGWGNQVGQLISVGSTNINYGGSPAAGNFILYNFKRAPSFFDEVCYTGTGSATTFSHNLQAVPEMMLIKRRDTTAQWQFYFAGLGNTKSVQMPDNDKVTSSGLFNNTSPTSSVFTVGVNSPVNASGGTYVAYLAATCAGVSKVGTYTGTGTTQQIDCGFAAGARFVLIKNVGVNDYAYGYYVWDTARGIVSGNDPYLLLNSTAAEVTNTDYIDTYSAGFEISSTAPAGINANGDQFVYWAIA